jgi:hypothetical protein
MSFQELFITLLSSIGVIGVIGIGIWVGTIQTRVNVQNDTTGNLSSIVKDDHDLLIEIRTKLDMLLQRLTPAQAA